MTLERTAKSADTCGAYGLPATGLTRESGSAERGNRRRAGRRAVTGSAYPAEVTQRSASGDAPEEFLAALSELRAARLRPEIVLSEVPPPARIAPYAVALSADVVVGADQEELASGRFVLLHDPSAPDPWHGTFRAVTFARAELEPEMGSDPVLGAVGWSWLTDALAGHGAAYVAAGGTVTRVVSESYGALDDRPASVEMEVRASWTPVGDGLQPGIADHLAAWSDLLCTIAGLPPVPDGVTALPSRRR
jgi:hypothetical protein